MIGMVDQTDRLLKLYGDNYDLHFKGANYLFVAHGAGLVGCLAMVKDYATTPSYKGVGVFIIVFGCGFLTGILYYASLAFTRATVMNSLMDRKEPDAGTIKFLTNTHFVTLLLCLLFLVAAVIGLMVKFAKL
jgi:hypothetical protein